MADAWLVMSWLGGCYGWRVSDGLAIHELSPPDCTFPEPSARARPDTYLLTHPVSRLQFPPRRPDDVSTNPRRYDVLVQLTRRKYWDVLVTHPSHARANDSTQS